MSFKDTPPWVSLDENYEELAYVQVTESTDTPEKAVAHLFDSNEGRDMLDLNDTTGPSPSPAYNVAHPEEAKVQDVTVRLPVAVISQPFTNVWLYVRESKADAFWVINISDAVVPR